MPFPSGQIYLRPDLLYFGRDRIHLASNTEHSLTPVDAALLELVFRGYSDFATLQATVSGMVEGPHGAAVAARVAEVMADPHSIMELRAAPPLDAPDVIVCDFTTIEDAPRGREVARRLRRWFRVALLGADEHVRGDPRCNASFAMTKKAGHHQTWYEFLQWCRGFVGGNPQALLVLCGQQDAVLLGDLVRRVRSVVVTSNSWPSPTTPIDLYGSRQLPADEFEATRALFYAMQFCNTGDWNSVNRWNCSDLAVLECAALRNAAMTVYGSVDQLGSLLRLGLRDDSVHFAHRVLTHPRRQPGTQDRDTLVVIGSVEAGGVPLMSFLRLLFSLPVADRHFGRAMVATSAGWFEVVVREGGGIGLCASVPQPSFRCIGAIALTGLLRDPTTAFEVMSGGVPTVFVPSARRHPLMAYLPEDMLLRESSPSTLRTLLAAWHDRQGSWCRRLLGLQADLDRRLGIVQRIRDVAQAGTQRESQQGHNV